MTEAARLFSTLGMHFIPVRMTLETIPYDPVWKKDEVQITLHYGYALDNLGMVGGQSHFYKTTNGTLTDHGGEMVLALQGQAELTSPLFPNRAGTPYNMLMPRRNTVFMVLTNRSTAKTATLRYKTSLHDCRHGKTLRLADDDQPHAYYFNLSDTPCCDGRLLQFTLCAEGEGEIIIHRYSFEQEKPLIDYAGAITSCTADPKAKTIKVCGKDLAADYRVRRMAFGREVHLLSGIADLEGDTIGIKVGGGTGAAPVSMIFMQNERFLCGHTGLGNVLFLNGGKLAFSFTSAKPFDLPELISLGAMTIREGKMNPIGWQPPAGAVKFEAENIASETLPQALISERDSASGGKASCSWDTDGKRGTWKFTVPADGKYQLAICHATTYSRVGREILIDGKHLTPDTVGMVLRSTGGFGYSPAEWRWSVCPVTFKLTAGEHELTIANMYSSCNYDAFALIPAK
jgi:hypothetical protein